MPLDFHTVGKEPPADRDDSSTVMYGGELRSKSLPKLFGKSLKASRAYFFSVEERSIGALGSLLFAS
jgi:hypothetical protein